MKLENIKLIHKGRFLNYYKLYYRMSDGSIKVYEMVSKVGSDNDKSDIMTVDTLGRKSKAVVVQIFNPDHTKMLLSKEYRLGVNRYIYNNVAGFVEPGETYEQAAIREVKEETGLDVINIIDVLAPSYTSAPVCDDLVPVVICEADGKIENCLDEIELTEPEWVTKDELKQLLKENSIEFSGRLQAFGYMWCYGGKYESKNN